jgi:hypothetical protein
MYTLRKKLDESQNRSGLLVKRKIPVPSRNGTPVVQRKSFISYTIYEKIPMILGFYASSKGLSKLLTSPYLLPDIRSI